MVSAIWRLLGASLACLRHFRLGSLAVHFYEFNGGLNFDFVSHMYCMVLYITRRSSHLSINCTAVSHLTGRRVGIAYQNAISRGDILVTLLHNFRHWISCFLNPLDRLSVLMSLWNSALFFPQRYFLQTRPHWRNVNQRPIAKPERTG